MLQVVVSYRVQYSVWYYGESSLTWFSEIHISRGMFILKGRNFFGCEYMEFFNMFLMTAIANRWCAGHWWSVSSKRLETAAL